MDAAAPACWTRTLWFAVAVQCLMSLAVSVTAPILPLYIAELGIHDVAAIEIWSGAVYAVPFIFAALTSPIWGAIGDRFGRKSMVLRSSAAICLFSAAMAFAQNVEQLFVLRALVGCVSGFSAAAIALVATQVPTARLGYSLGWLSTGQLVGGLLGPLTGGLIADLAGNYASVFLWTALLAGLSWLLTYCCIDEAFSPPARSSTPEPGKRRIRRLDGMAKFLPLVLVLLTVQISVASVQPITTIFVAELLGPAGNLATLSGLAFSITGFADLLASPFLGKRSDVIGYRKVLLICTLGAVLMSAPQGFAGSYGEFLAERFGLGLFIGGIIPTTNALIGRLAPPHRRGAIFGMTAAATFLGNLIGPVARGLNSAEFGVRRVFVAVAVMLARALVWVYVGVAERGRAPEG